MKKQKSSYSSQTSKLPGNYRELYFDSCKQNWRKLVGYGLLFLVFALPLLAVLFFKDYYTLGLAASSMSDEEKEALKVTSEIYFALGSSVVLLITMIGVSGLSRVMLLLSREEPVFFFHDFAKGVKNNIKTNFVFFLIYSALLFGCYFIIANFRASFASYIPLGILQTLFFPLLLIQIETTSIYDWKIRDSFYNSALIFIKNFIFLVLFSLVFSTPLLVLGITNIFIKYIILSLLIIIIYPFFALMLRVYMNYVLDRDINYKYYPELYKKGIYIPEVTNTTAHTFNINSTYKDLIEDKELSIYSYHLLSYIDDYKKLLNDKIIPFGVGAWPKEPVISSLNLLKELKMKRLTLTIKRKGYSALLLKQENLSKVAIVMAGGGYSSVCTLPEDLPVSTELYKKGFTVVSFSYSVNENARESINELVDLIKQLTTHQGRFNINMSSYIVVGFSAGAHLVGELATDNYGYEHSNILKPGLLVLGYPVVDLSLCDGTRNNLLGEKQTNEEIIERSINHHIYTNTPNMFIWQCENDNVVPFENSIRLIEALKKNNIEFSFEQFSSDVHGWGIAKDTLADGWVDRMVDFYYSLTQNKNIVQ